MHMQIYSNRWMNILINVTLNLSDEWHLQVQNDCKNLIEIISILATWLTNTVIASTRKVVNMSSYVSQQCVKDGTVRQYSIFQMVITADSFWQWIDIRLRLDRNIFKAFDLTCSTLCSVYVTMEKINAKSKHNFRHIWK